MKRAVDFILNNWISVTVGLFLTAWAFRSAYEFRGYVAIGSEWLVLPFTVFALKGAKRFIEELVDMWKSFEEYEEDEEDRNVRSM